MTKKLYYENQYIKEFKAEILDIKEKDGKFHVVLDETAFFPGGGGQHCDKGNIDVHKVLDVYEEDGVIYHVVDKKPIKIHKVPCSIDWANRFDGMQQHLGQHVLSGCFFDLFNANTFGFHLGKEICTVDIEGPMDEEKIRTAEKMANEVIFNNLKVEFSFPTKSELKKLKLRRALPNTNEEIRIVNIVDLDLNACCGVHPSSTLELQMIKIKRWEKHKQGVRIEYVAGKRAVDNAFEKDAFASNICKFLKCGEQDAINSINKLNDNLKDAIDRNKKMEAEVGEYKIKEMIDSANKFGDIKVIKQIHENGDFKYINRLVGKLVEEENLIVLFAVTSPERANLIFACSKDLKVLNMSDLLKDAISLIDGKGGGSLFAAQGAGKNNSNLVSAMDYAFMKVKNSLS